METLFSGSLESLSWLINYIKDVSILICLIFVIKFIAAKKLPAWWSYSLWLMLLIRMFIPWQFENKLNISNVVPLSIDKDMFGAMFPAKEIVMSGIERTMIAATTVATSTTSSAATSVVQGFSISLDKAMLFIWLAGAIGLGIYILVRNIRFWIMIKRSAVLADKRTLDLLEECKDQINVHRAVDIIITDNVKSPALFGYFRPRLLLPEGILEHFSHEELSYVFMHELGHLKRHDIAVICLMTLFQTIHWFNPLVWLAFYQMRIDQESACDASVLSRLRHHQPVEYANAIVGFLERYCQNRQLPSMAGILENKTQMKRRLAMIVHYKKLSTKMTVIAIALLIVSGFVFYALTGFAKEEPVHKTSNQEIDKIKAPHSTSDVTLPESNKIVISILKDGRVYFSMDGVIYLRSLGEQLNVKYKLGLTEGDVKKFSTMSAFGMPLTGLKGFFELSDKERENISQPGIPIQEGGNELFDWLDCAMTANPNADLYIKADKASPYSILKKIKASLQDDNINSFSFITDTEKAKLLILPESGTTTNGSKHSVARYIAPVVVLETQANKNENTLISGPKVNERNVLSIILNGHNKIYWYIGFTNAQVNETDYSEAGIRKVLQDQDKSNDKLVVLVKPDESSTFENLLSALDELTITNTSRYALVELEDEDKALIQRYLTSGNVQSSGSDYKDENVDTERVYKASDVDEPPKVIKQIDPTISPEELEKYKSGRVGLRFIVTKEGTVKDATITESVPDVTFGELGLEAIRQSTYQPGIKNGKPVDVLIEGEIHHL